MKLTRAEAVEYIKDSYTESYLHQKGIPTNKNIRCLSATHEDRNASMRYSEKTKRLQCFGCETKMDIFDLIGMDYGLRDFNEQLKKACDMYGVEIVKDSTGDYKPKKKEPVSEPEPEPTTDKYTQYYTECNRRLQEAYNDGFYMARRGISLETLNRFNVGFDPEYRRYDGAKPVQAVIMPNSNGYFTPRAIDPAPDELKNPYRKGDKRGLFNAEALEDTERPCIVCEGEVDALSLHEAGGNVTGLGGTSGVNLLLSALRNRKSETMLVLALDNDKAGKEATERIEKGIRTLLEDRQVKPEHVQYIVLNPYHNEKDGNDSLLVNRRLFQKDIGEIMQNPKKWGYINTRCASSYINEFWNVVASKANTPPVSTGFYGIDEALGGGGLYEGLYCIGAVSSLGKTTLCQQIADNIAMGKSGYDVIYVSLEMSRLELMAKTISRLTYINTVINGECGADERNAKTTRGILDGSRYRKYSEQEKALISLSVRDYAESVAGRMFIEEGMGNIGTKEIREIVKNHEDATGNKAVLFIDYLQLIAPADPRASDKQNMDKSIMELKRISRDFKIPVVVISSFNRANYASEEGVSELAFKESGAIEYSVDTLIGLEFTNAKSMKEVREAKARNPREVDFVILKNRNAGIPANPIPLNYNPLFNYFEE